MQVPPAATVLQSGLLVQVYVFTESFFERLGRFEHSDSLVRQIFAVGSVGDVHVQHGDAENTEDGIKNAMAINAIRIEERMEERLIGF